MAPLTCRIPAQYQSQLLKVLLYFPPPAIATIATRLQSIASAFKDVGYEDVADLIVEPFPAQQLPAFLGNVGAHPPQITRISTALCTIGGLTTDPNPNRGLPVGPSYVFFFLPAYDTYKWQDGGSLSGQLLRLKG